MTFPEAFTANQLGHDVPSHQQVNSKTKNMHGVESDALWDPIWEREQWTLNGHENIGVRSGINTSLRDLAFWWFGKCTKTNHIN